MAAARPLGAGPGAQSREDRNHPDQPLVFPGESQRLGPAAPNPRAAGPPRQCDALAVRAVVGGPIGTGSARHTARRAEYEPENRAGRKPAPVLAGRPTAPPGPRPLPDQKDAMPGLPMMTEDAATRSPWPISHRP